MNNNWNGDSTLSYDGDKYFSNPTIPNYIPLKQNLDSVETESDNIELTIAEDFLNPLMTTPAKVTFQEESYPIELVGKGVSEGKPKLYALLIGIDRYQESILLANNKVKFPKLYGCVSDTSKVKEYLISETSFESYIEILTDEAATKQQVVSLFKKHLGKAGEKDTVFFYFSGHGTQEFADRSVFQSETDGRLEALACYYKESDDDFLLADKELRWLIYSLSLNKPHIVTVFDCCHSGDNTRNGYLIKNSFNNVVEKRVPFVFPQRNWDQFIFSREVDRDILLQFGEHKAFPEGKHFQFSACESDESAVEVSGEAVFTKTLLKVLNTTAGEITYHSLGSRIRQYLRNVYEQKPKIYIACGEPNDIFVNFLNKPLNNAASAFSDVIFNENNGWQLGLGAIHGIGKNTPAFKIFDPGNPAKTFLATIRSVHIDSADLLIGESIDQNKVYKAHIEGLTGGSLHIHFATQGAELSEQARLFDQLLANSKQIIIPEDDEQQAQYVLRYLNGKYYLTYPGDPFRPLLKPVEAFGHQADLKIASDLKHIANWEFLKNLDNKDPVNQLSAKSLKIEIAVGSSPSDFKVINDDASINIDYSLKGSKWVNSMSVRLTNDTDRNLYCCVLYLMSNFASYSRYLTPPVKMLTPGETVELKYKESAIINLGVDQVMKWYNWEAQKDYLKFIISTESFDAALLDFKQLDAPDIPIILRHVDNEYSDEVTVFENNSGWFTRQVELVLKNPLHNLIKESELRAMLDNYLTEDFALGLYFDLRSDNFTPSYTLKSTIKISDEHTRGIVGDRIIDIANWWARKSRNKYYSDAVLRFPNRVRMVAEGDSWFQHPLVLDIIDHLHRVYNIYCVSAAGDTLRNYFSQEKNNGDYFLNAIDKQEPAFYLISGGGNDILGTQFRSFLKDDSGQDYPEGLHPGRFLKDELFREFDSLMDIYRTTFQHLKVHKPRLRVIVHGYDYPVKLNDAKKGWLGKYMIEKGIRRAEDRRAIIHLIMDTFNEKLFELSKGFDNVTYLDLRNIIRFDEKEKVDQWYDEIHPNNDGFQQIAMKFMQTIDGLIAKDRVLPSSI